jgi:Na+-translocating ferredoxin:NAD+ oxidoreductase RnfC subunit
MSIDFSRRLRDNSDQFFNLTQERNRYKRGTKRYLQYTQELRRNKVERYELRREAARVKRQETLAAKHQLMIAAIQTLGSNKEEIATALEDIELTIASIV